jgi:hypothetical protein
VLERKSAGLLICPRMTVTVPGRPLDRDVEGTTL